MNIQGLFRNVDFREVNAKLGLNMGGKKTSEIRGEENMDSNRDLEEEDCPIEVGEGKKQPRSSYF